MRFLYKVVQPKTRHEAQAAAATMHPKLSSSVTERGVHAASTYELGRCLNILKASGFRTLKRG